MLLGSMFILVFVNSLLHANFGSISLNDTFVFLPLRDVWRILKTPHVTYNLFATDS